jgi:hypothetical protein
LYGARLPSHPSLLAKYKGNMPLGDKALLPLTSGRIWARPKSIPISLTVGERRRERERRKEDRGEGEIRKG